MKNIVLITVDCLRKNRCSHNGHIRNTTPNLDSLCSDSYVFRSAVSPGPRTSESVPGILSGRLSHECEYVRGLPFKSIPSSAQTLASFASDHGYNTIATIANPQLSPIRNFDRGFDVFRNLRIADRGDRFDQSSDEDENSSESVGTPLINEVGEKLLEIGQSLPVNPASLPFALYRHKQLRGDWPTIDGERVVDQFLKELSSSEPFFAWTHLNDVHAPLHPQRARDGGLISATNTRQFLADAKRARHDRTLFYDLMYDSVVRYVDQQIGRIINHLERRGIRDETAIIVTADHGEALHDRGYYEHASGNQQRLYESDRDYLYRELLDVPLVVNIPDEDGGEITAPFSLTWMHQIIADIMGVKDGEFPQSADYSDRIFDANEMVLADALTENGHTVAAINDSTKVITDGTTPESINQENWHVFTRADRSEGQRAEKIPSEIVQALNDHITNPSSIQETKGEMKEETMDQLASLGYR